MKKPKNLQREARPPSEPVPIEWPLTIHVCNVCHGVDTHPIFCDGTFEEFRVAPDKGYRITLAAIARGERKVNGAMRKYTAPELREMAKEALDERHHG